MIPNDSTLTSKPHYLKLNSWYPSNGILQILPFKSFYLGVFCAFIYCYCVYLLYIFINFRN